jgi:isoamylase
VNAWWEPLEFVISATGAQAAWHVEIDTYDPASATGSGMACHVGDRVTVGSRSVVVLSDPVPS